MILLVSKNPHSGIDSTDALKNLILVDLLIGEIQTFDRECYAPHDLPILVSISKVAVLV